MAVVGVVGRLRQTSKYNSIAASLYQPPGRTAFPFANLIPAPILISVLISVLILPIPRRTAIVSIRLPLLLNYSSSFSTLGSSRPPPTVSLQFSTVLLDARAIPYLYLVPVYMSGTSCRAAVILGLCLSLKSHFLKYQV